MAVAPDLYHRQGRFLTGEYTNPAGVMAHFATLDTDSMAADIGAAVDWAAAAEGVESTRIGAIGFCLGGYGAVLAAVRSTPAVVAGFYGAGLSIRREQSPLATLADEFGSIECPVLLFYGQDDPVIPAAEVDATRSALESAAIDHEVHAYPGAGHGFFCDVRASFAEQPAEYAWDG